MLNITLIKHIYIYMYKYLQLCSFWTVNASLLPTNSINAFAKSKSIDFDF